MISGQMQALSVFKKRVVVVDDLQAINVLSHVVEHSSSFKFIKGYSSMEEAIKNLRYDKPDIILTEIELEGVSGIDGIFEIHKMNTGIDIIVYSRITSIELVRNAFANGAIGYLLKQEVNMKFMDYLVELIQGGSPISPTPARMLVNSMRRNTASPLSYRETEVLKLLSKGNTYSEMADILCISKDTTKTHLRNIYRKLGVSSRSMVIKVAMEERLI